MHDASQIRHVLRARWCQWSYPLQEVCNPWNEGCAKDSRRAHSFEKRVWARLSHALCELVELLHNAT